MTSLLPLTLTRVLRDVGAGDRAEREARRRLGRLSAVDHPGLVMPIDVRRDGEAVQVCTPRVAEPSLADAVGPGIGTLGEWVWLVGGVAEALAALHAAGLAHGDVTPANVLVGSRPLLIDLVGPALGGERGTPGAREPERAAGPSPAGDVYALGLLARSVAAPAIAVQVHAWTAPLLDEDPGARPSAAAVARGVGTCAAPVRWVPPRAVAGAQMRAASAVAVTERDARARARLMLWRAAATVAAVAACAVGVWFAVPDRPAGFPTSLAEPGEHKMVERGTPAIIGDLAVDPASAATELTRARFDAWRRGDGEALEDLAVPGSPAWSAVAHDAALLDGGARVEGLDPPDVAARVLTADGQAATVEVVTRIGAHTVVDGAGSRARVEARVETAVLELDWSGERWRVSALSDPS